MCVLAQCENVVTLREPMRCPQGLSRTAGGSKLPVSAQVARNQPQIVARIWAFVSEGVFAYLRIFSKITANQGELAKRNLQIVHYPFCGPFFAIVSGWFGPKFVTILAIGVRVCRI